MHTRGQLPCDAFASPSSCRQKKAGRPKALPSVRVLTVFALASRVCPRAYALPVLVNLNRYIKLVVIVNAGRVVDKAGLLNRLKGLRGKEGAEQGLCLARTLTGQKAGSQQTRQFRTFDPVDMHGFIHNR